MKSFIPVRFAIKGLLIILSLFLVFHVLVMIGIIPFTIVWGGKIKDKSEMLTFETISILVNLIMIVVIMIKGRLITLMIYNRLIYQLIYWGIIIIAPWIMFGIFLLNTIGNLFSNNDYEKMVFTPLTIILAILSFSIAYSQEDEKTIEENRIRIINSVEYKKMLIKKDEFLNKLNGMINKTDILEQIKLCEDELNKIPKTPYHKIVGLNLLHQTNELTDWIIDFYNKGSKKIKIKSIYFEMNGFTINPDEWFVSGFGYSIYNDNDKDLDWLGDSEFSSDGKNDFVIKGFEDIQKVYENGYDNSYEYLNYDYAYQINEYLVILRLQELFIAAYKEARQKNVDLQNIPILVTAHDYEFILRIK
jgi:hypothetical protein